MFRKRAALHLLSAIAWGGAESSTSLQTTAPPQDSCILLYRINIDTVDFFSPQSGFLTELKLAQVPLRTDHGWQFTFTWVALLIRQSPAPEEETQESHLPTDYS